MFFAKKAPRSYVVLYQKVLYKSFSLLMTPLPHKILLTPTPMHRRLHLGQGAQCYVIFKELCPSALVSLHLPNDLPTQRLDNLCVTHQSQVTYRRLSYEAVFFSFATVPGDNIHCIKRIAVIL